MFPFFRRKQKKNNDNVYECEILESSDQKRKKFRLFLKKYYVITFLVALSFFAMFAALHDKIKIDEIPKIIQKSHPVNGELEKPNIFHSGSSNDIFPPEEIYSKCSKSIVGITISQNVMSFWGNMSQSKAQGSGVIMSQNGYIITNAHVVNTSDPNASISVKIKYDNNTEEVNAKLVGKDLKTDLAVIKINKTDLLPVSFGNSEDLRPGNTVYAIGAPAGLEWSITSGIVSGLNRIVSEDIWSTEYIQTDAAINPGNSGGGLFNSRGELIGINSAKLIDTDIEGIGFAIPVNDVAKISEELINKGYIARPALGVTVVKKDEGLTIVGFSEHSKFKKFANKGDIIVGINGKKVNDVDDLRSEIKNHSIGDEVTINLKSPLNSEFSVKTELTESDTK